MVLTILIITTFIAILLFYRYQSNLSVVGKHFRGLTKSTKSTLRSNATFLEHLWANELKNNENSLPSWRSDQVTTNQLHRLRDDGYKVLRSKEITKGMASDVIGLLKTPSGEDSNILFFFGISNKNISETHARAKIAEIFSDPKNRERWESGPANDFECHIYKMITPNAPERISSKDAQDFICEHLSDLPERISEHYLQMNDWWLMINEEEERQKIGIRKPTLQDFTNSAIEAIEESRKSNKPAKLEDVLIAMIRKKLRKSLSTNR